MSLDSNLSVVDISGSSEHSSEYLALVLQGFLYREFKNAQEADKIANQLVGAISSLQPPRPITYSYNQDLGEVMLVRLTKPAYDKFAGRFNPDDSLYKMPNPLLFISLCYQMVVLRTPYSLEAVYFQIFPGYAPKPDVCPILLNGPDEEHRVYINRHPFTMPGFRDALNLSPIIENPTAAILYKAPRESETSSL